MEHTSKRHGESTSYVSYEACIGIDILPPRVGLAVHPPPPDLTDGLRSYDIREYSDALASPYL